MTAPIPSAPRNPPEGTPHYECDLVSSRRQHRVPPQSPRGRQRRHGALDKSRRLVSQNLTQGYIPARIANQLGSRMQCDRLVKVGLFTEKDGGYQFHSWDYRDLSEYEKAARDSSARTPRRPRLSAVPSTNPTKGPA
jgi:hypothetical protein